MDLQNSLIGKLFIIIIIIVLFLWLVNKFIRFIEFLVKGLSLIDPDESLWEESTPPKKCDKCESCGKLLDGKEKSDADKLYEDISSAFKLFYEHLLKLHSELAEKFMDFIRSKFYPLLDTLCYKSEGFLKKVLTSFHFFFKIIFIILVAHVLAFASFLIRVINGFSFVIKSYNNSFFPWLLPKLCNFEQKYLVKLLSGSTGNACWDKLRGYKFVKNLFEVPKSPAGFLFKVIKFIFWVIIFDIIVGQIAFWNVVCALLGVFFLIFMWLLIKIMKKF